MVEDTRPGSLRGRRRHRGGDRPRTAPAPRLHTGEDPGAAARPPRRGVRERRFRLASADLERAHHAGLPMAGDPTVKLVAAQWESEADPPRTADQNVNAHRSMVDRERVPEQVVVG